VVNWKTLGEAMEKSRLQRQAEAARLAVDPGPTLEAVAVGGIRDWTTELSVLYGAPLKTGGGWGVEVYPTRQQEALLHRCMDKVDPRTGQPDETYVAGKPAVSFDKSGRARELTITEQGPYWTSEHVRRHQGLLQRGAPYAVHAGLVAAVPLRCFRLV